MPPLTVHWENGWLVLSDSSSWLANDRIMEAVPRKAEIISILREHGDYRWLTARGSVTILNNGIEFAAIYFVMLLSLFFTGGGRFTSVDYWLARLTTTRAVQEHALIAGPDATYSEPPASRSLTRLAELAGMAHVSIR